MSTAGKTLNRYPESLWEKLADEPVDDQKCHQDGYGLVENFENNGRGAIWAFFQQVEPKRNLQRHQQKKRNAEAVVSKRCPELAVGKGGETSDQATARAAAIV